MNLTLQKPLQSIELQILNYLNPRSTFPSNLRQQYSNLLKGHSGEQHFYNLLKEELTIGSIAIYDLLLESDQTVFQIDCLLIFQNKIILFEVKNYEGDFYIEDDKWYVSTNKREIRNPLLQLERSEFLLRQILQQTGQNYDISSHVVFVNEQFTLYHAPLHLPILFRAQISQFINELNKNSAVITQTHKKLANTLIDMNMTDSPYDRIPNYNYDEIKKGIICLTCSGFMNYDTYHVIACPRCHIKETMTHAVLRSVNEFALLFPSRKITTTNIHEWCNIVKSRKTIRRILMKHMNLVRKGRYSYFKFK